jgi:hypothetical protein
MHQVVRKQDPDESQCPHSSPPPVAASVARCGGQGGLAWGSPEGLGLDNREHDGRPMCIGIQTAIRILERDKL